MLNRLLEMLREGSVRRVADLARELETTPELIEMMLEDLCRKGYLGRAEGACGEGCGSCSMTGMCAAGSGGKLWSLTEKGETNAVG